MIKAHYNLLLALLALSMLSACSLGDTSLAWNKIHEGAQLIDVRTAGEYQDGHLPGAKLIPVDELASRLDELGDDKTRPVVVYCKSGVRSSRAQKLLTENGFTDVVNGGGYASLMSVKP